MMRNAKFELHQKTDEANAETDQMDHEGQEQQEPPSPPLRHPRQMPKQHLHRTRDYVPIGATGATGGGIYSTSIAGIDDLRNYEI